MLIVQRNWEQIGWKTLTYSWSVSFANVCVRGPVWISQKSKEDLWNIIWVYWFVESPLIFICTKNKKKWESGMWNKESGMWNQEKWQSADRDTTVCWKIPFPERSQCAEGYEFQGPRESVNALFGISQSHTICIALTQSRWLEKTGNNQHPDALKPGIVNEVNLKCVLNCFTIE